MAEMAERGRVQSTHSEKDDLSVAASDLLAILLASMCLLERPDQTLKHSLRAVFSRSWAIDTITACLSWLAAAPSCQDMTTRRRIRVALKPQLCSTEDLL